jgi:hypothetical protein
MLCSRIAITWSTLGDHQRGTEDDPVGIEAEQKAVGEKSVAGMTEGMTK